MFKLVRIDDEDHHEIDLIDGKQVIGRDQLVNCNDKRISRQHTELEATVDSVSIKALHLNPCFFVKNDMTEAQILKRNSSINCYHGDKIGFLRESHWFETTNVAAGCVVAGPVAISPLKAIIEKCLLNSEEDGADEESTKTFAVSSTEENKETTDASAGEHEQASNHLCLYQSRLHPRTSQRNRPNEANLATGPTRATKRSLVKEEPPSPVGFKKVKKEPEPEDVKPNINLPSTSSDSKTSGDQESPPSDQHRSKRERCMYGTDCYRRNLEHKAQFSHPGDEDFGAGAQAECPYGYPCAKRDPRHWRDHSHPDGMHPPPPPGQEMRITRAMTSPQPYTVIPPEDWSDWESEEEPEDPYGTDGDSDGWSLPSDITDSQDYSEI